MRLILTSLSHKKLLGALERGGRRSLYFRDSHGLLHSAELRAEISRTTVRLTLRHKTALHSIDLNTQKPDLDLRAENWVEDCANGVEDAA